MGVTSDRAAAPLATELLFRLIHHHYVMRQHAGADLPVDCDPHDPLLRRYAAAEASVGLLLTHVLAEVLEPPMPERLVPLAERLALGLQALDGLITNALPLDTIMPRLSNQAQRQHLLPAPLASLLVQTTLAVVLAAIADEARWIVVATPRAPEGGVLLTIEADAAGLADGAQDALARRLGAALADVGGTLRLTATAHQSWRAAVWAPNGGWPGGGTPDAAV